jgi:hypothetical protein
MGVLSGVLLLAGLAVAAVMVRHHVVYGRVVDETQLTVTVHRGDRLSLAVPDAGASVGDEWSATVAPQGALTSVDSRLVPANLVDRLFGPAAGGGGGTRYFIYTAGRRGTATVRLVNCFQGGCGEPGDTISRAVTWTVTVD